MVNGVRWGDLSVFGPKHEIIGESYAVKEQFSFAGGHRVRLVSLKKNVDWKVEEFQSMLIDIADVKPENPPRRAVSRRQLRVRSGGSARIGYAAFILRSTLEVDRALLSAVLSTHRSR